MHGILLWLLLSSHSDEFPASLNVLAVLGFAVAAVVAAVGLFALPVLRSFGLSFREAFLVVGLSEFAAAVVAAVSAYHFYSRQET
jgi:hypothetical protein